MSPIRPPGERPVSGMTRRRAIAVVGAAAVTSLAGCASTLARTRTLSDPHVVDEGDEVHLRYTDDGDDVATVSILDRWTIEPQWRYALRTSLWHEDGSTTDRLRYEFRPLDAEVPPEIYLKQPGGYPWEPIEFGRGEDPETTVLEVPDLGFQGEGTVSLDFLVEPRQDDPVDLEVRVEATISSESTFGGEYEIQGSAVRTIPGSGPPE